MVEKGARLLCHQPSKSLTLFSGPNGEEKKTQQKDGKDLEIRCFLFQFGRSHCSRKSRIRQLGVSYYVRNHKSLLVVGCRIVAEKEETEYGVTVHTSVNCTMASCTFLQFMIQNPPATIDFY